MFFAAADELHSYSGAGFHLLSCPHLLDEQQKDSNEIILTRKSAEKLLSLLSSSANHASVLKTGGDSHRKRGLHRIISDAVEKQTGKAETSKNKQTLA